MADRAITALTAATSMTDADLFAISQGGQAKKVSWATFYQYLSQTLWAHGGIRDIDYTAPASGSLDGTVTITFGDETSDSFSITNGRGITGIEKTGTDVLEDTYTVSYNNDTTSTFSVVNGRGITDVTKESEGLEDTYTFAYNDGTTSELVVTNGRAISAITDYYAVTDDAGTQPSAWSTDLPPLTPTNKYLWSFQTITFNDDTTLDTSERIIGVYGDTGQNWYVHIKYAAQEPTADSDMSNVPDNWMGVYSGTSSTAPTAYTSYSWFEIKGEKGDTGNGIESISLYSSSDLVDTYRIAFFDGTYTTFNVTNGSSISGIEKTGTSGLVDTYTVTLTDGSTTSFDVTNGNGISSVTPVDVTHAAGHTDVYRINFTNGDTYNFSVYNGANGSGAVSTVDDISATSQNVTLLTFGQGAPTSSTPGVLKSRYFDRTNSVLYICTGSDTSGDTPVYTWQGTGVTVDNTLSSASTNPVQNAILTAIIGTASLNTTAQTLTGAVNELDSDIGNKVDKVSGKGLSTNDFTDAYKNKIGTASLNTSASDLCGAINEHETDLSGKVDKESGKGLSTNDFTNAYKNKIGTATLNTSSADLCGAINEHETDLIGKVNKAGDTMTGILTNTANFRKSNTTVGAGDTLPSNVTYGGFYVTDKNLYSVGWIEAVAKTDGSTFTRISARTKNGSTNISNNLDIGANKDGTLVVNVTSPQAWRKALGIGTSAGAFPIPIDQGGTGATARAGNTGAVHSLFNESVGTDTTHFLGIKSDWSKAGYLTLQQARNKLGLGNTTGAVPIANGGTGSSTAAAARTELGVSGCVKQKLISKVSSGQTINAGAFLDFSMGVGKTSGDSQLIAIYSGNPYCLITNIFVSNNIITATIFNPTSSAKTLGTTSGQAVRLLELYPV